MRYRARHEGEAALWNGGEKANARKKAEAKTQKKTAAIFPTLD